MKRSGTKYLEFWGIVILFLALVRLIFPSLATAGKSTSTTTHDTDSTRVASLSSDSIGVMPAYAASVTRYVDAKGQLIKNKILSVPGFSRTFPDMNDVQMASAQKWGVKPIANRQEAEKRKNKLVFVGSNPFFEVEELKNSIPYLVPSAAILLQDIGKNYYDSLLVKGVPLHKLIVTSVTRSREDIGKLRNRNRNATENSCHLYGTTFDICYNRYVTVSDPEGKANRSVRNDTLKWILSEVLKDMRERNRCWVKYEVKQGCFHITVK